MVKILYSKKILKKLQKISNETGKKIQLLSYIKYLVKKPTDAASWRVRICLASLGLVVTRSSKSET